MVGKGELGGIGCFLEAEVLGVVLPFSGRDLGGMGQRSLSSLFFTGRSVSFMSISGGGLEDSCFIQRSRHDCAVCRRF